MRGLYYLTLYKHYTHLFIGDWMDSPKFDNHQINIAPEMEARRFKVDPGRGYGIASEYAYNLKLWPIFKLYRYEFSSISPRQVVPRQITNSNYIQECCSIWSSGA